VRHFSRFSRSGLSAPPATIDFALRLPGAHPSAYFAEGWEISLTVLVVGWPVQARYWLEWGSLSVMPLRRAQISTP